jgi:hypothetical protein
MFDGERPAIDAFVWAHCSFDQLVDFDDSHGC